MLPFLNEYMYQEALDILFEENDIVRVKEYYFSVTFHGRQIRHKHYVDFLVGNDVLIECKAIEQIGPEQRQQLWNYMRLSGICTGVLYNFAPVRDTNVNDTIWIKLLAICTHSNLFNKIFKNGLCVICAICERLSSPENYRRMPLW